jgi:hypothetical protein
VLNLVELVHYTPAIPCTLTVHLLISNADRWMSSALLGGSDWRLVALVLSPVLAVAGGLPGFTMHTYEGWQVAPFRNPLSEGVVDMQVKDNNNEWLREVAYKFIFLMQCALRAPLRPRALVAGRQRPWPRLPLRD